MPKTTEPLSIEPCEHEWPPIELRADLKAGRNVWREVTEEFYMESLNVLPPMDWHGPRFLVMEPICDDGDDMIHRCCVQIGKRFFTRNVPRRQAGAMCDALLVLVRTQEAEQAALDKEIAECPDCNAGPVGPVPAYCRKHDGDYSDWLAMNNID